MKKKGIIIVISAPSGAGKSTLYKKLVKTVPNLSYSISYTTRSRRKGEVNGRDYFFVTEPKFKSLIKKGEFVEWARVHGNYYGTSRRLIERIINSGRDIILDIDVQGAVSIRKLYPTAVLIFIMAPSFKELEKRIRKRKKDSEETIKKRLCNARKELKFMPHYDYLVINDKLSNSLCKIKSIIATEHYKLSRISVPDFR
ncbi:MAG: guanylate kinase [Endomicrobiales bacterium]|nr:guanylate kinase [Endomicrobiales bacterium]